MFDAVQDERIQMAFSSTSATGSACRSQHVSAHPFDLSPSSSQAHPDTPRLSSQSRQAQSSSALMGDSRTGSVSSVTKNLETIGFGSPT